MWPLGCVAAGLYLEEETRQGLAGAYLGVPLPGQRINARKRPPTRRSPTTTAAACGPEAGGWEPGLGVVLVVEWGYNQNGLARRRLIRLALGGWLQSEALSTRWFWYRPPAKSIISGVNMIIWDDSMSTGIPIIDEQHKMLFQKFNDFSEAMSEMTVRETAGEILDFLQFYVVWHFGQEEKCMNEYKCPIAAENEQAHAEFIRTFSQFYTQWQEGTMTPDLVSKTYIELEKWLVDHILRVDTQLRPCVKSELNKQDIPPTGKLHTDEGTQ